MGIRHLDTFIRQKVPGGCIPVNIEDEIRKYSTEHSDSNPPAPIIVFDLITLYAPLSTHDRKGLLCGGRFNVAFEVIDRFFARLKSLGAKLAFFYDGPLQQPKNDTWCRRKENNYRKMLYLIDGIKHGLDLDTLVREFDPPLNFHYPLRYVAKKHGELKVSFARECDQEIAAFAIKKNALAIISSDSDYLIYEGSWRYWSSQDLMLETLTTVEYNKEALASHLGLDKKQMPLLATLAGNDLMPYDAVKKFHYNLGPSKQKFPNIARFIREQQFYPGQQLDIGRICQLVTRKSSVDPKLIECFELSMQSYDTNFKSLNTQPSEDPVRAILQAQDSPFMYQIWQSHQLNVTIGLIDLRAKDFDHLYVQLKLNMILRIAGIILYHRKPLQRSLDVAIKCNHRDAPRVQSYPIQFPTDIVPPKLPRLLSRNPNIQKGLRNTKYRLLCWIAPETLNHRKLQFVPKALQMTVYTLYYLLEAHFLNLFEADLLLQVAYDVIYKTYDPHELQYPQHLDSRPFRLVFLYQTMYTFVAKAFRLVRLNNAEVRDDPPFDGVLFHRRYDDWRQPTAAPPGRYETDSEMEEDL